VRRIIAAWIAAIFAALVASSAPAQTSFPARTVKFIVPFPGGGINDVLARIIGDKLQAKWGQPVVVENKTGAGGNIGADLAYQSEPDGYTLLLSPPGPLAINQTLYKHLSYKPQEFVPITVVGSVPNVVIVRKELPVTSLKELIDYVRANPGKVTFGSQGNGATPHLTAMMFRGMTDTQMVHVPYRGETLVLNDMIGGHVAGAARDSNHRRGRLAGARVDRLVRAGSAAEDIAGIGLRHRQSSGRSDQDAGRAGQVPRCKRRPHRQQPGRDGSLHQGGSATLGRGHQKEQYRRGLRRRKAQPDSRAEVKKFATM